VGLRTPIPSASRSARYDRLTPAECARAITDSLAQATGTPRTVPDS
jgi:hypothetical protein